VIEALLTQDFLLDPFRGWVARRFGAESKITYLSECPWCMSVWVAPVPTAVAVLWPDNRAVIFGLVALSASALTGLISTRLDD
jgi:hypothetical protein